MLIYEKCNIFQWKFSKSINTDIDIVFWSIYQDVQKPDTTEHVWKSIHDPGLTVIFQICHPSLQQNTDFSLKVEEFKTGKQKMSECEKKMEEIRTIQRKTNNIETMRRNKVLVFVQMTKRCEI
jgi:hypothetical protein